MFTYKTFALAASGVAVVAAVLFTASIASVSADDRLPAFAPSNPDNQASEPAVIPFRVFPPSAMRSEDEPLARALRDADLTTVKRLVKAGADVNFHVPPQMERPQIPSVLMLAAASGDTDFARKVIELGANVNLEDGGWTALKLAVASGNPEMVEILLKAGANAHTKGSGELTALGLAEGIGDSRLVEKLRRLDKNDPKVRERWIIMRKGGHSNLLLPKAQVEIVDRGYYTEVLISRKGSLTRSGIGWKGFTSYGFGVENVRVSTFAGLVFIRYQ